MLVHSYPPNSPSNPPGSDPGGATDYYRPAGVPMGKRRGAAVSGLLDEEAGGRVGTKERSGSGAAGDSAIRQLDEAAQTMHLGPGVHEVLRHPRRALEGAVPV